VGSSASLLDIFNNSFSSLRSNNGPFVGALDVSSIFVADSPLTPAGRTAISGRISTLFR
jgi:hypothetical protein